MDLGRQIKYGLGNGADAAATYWLNQLSFDLKPETQYATNNSAWGNIVRTNSSTPLRHWTSGSLEHKLTSDSTGLILKGAFGSVTTTDNADSDASVKDHTFDISEDINGAPLTLFRKDSISTRKYTNARIGEWQLTMELDDYIRFTANVLAKKGETTTATPAFLNETEFVASHFTVKSATSVGGLTGATDEATCESLTLTMNPNLEADNGSGSNQPYGFSSRGFELNFEMTCRYMDTTYEDAYNNGTQLSFQTSIVNTDVTIGAAAHPSLIFTAPKVFITDWTPNGDLDAPVSQTMTGTIHYSATDAYALRGVLTNLVPSY